MSKIYSESEMKAYAQEKSKSIMIRTYDEHGSNDKRVKATKRQRDIVAATIYGALLTVNQTPTALQSAKDTAEMIADLLLPEINGYDTVYIPIERFFKD